MAFSAQRGTNISHWLSQSKTRGPGRRAFFMQDDVRWIAAQGFDHIRLPIDEEQMWTADGQRELEAFELMNLALDWCAAAGLKTIVDLHILRSHYFMDKSPPLFTDPKEAEKFCVMWRDLSGELGRRSAETVAYELMNESVATDPEDWNRVARGAFNAIRQLEPESTGRVIVLGSNRWNTASTFDTLWVPEDKNILLTFHYYNPMLVTHYRASWMPATYGYTGPVNYPGKPVAEADLAGLAEPLQSEIAKGNEPYDAARMEADIAKPLAVQKRTGLPLYCGEFGVHHPVPDEVRIRWYRDFISVLDKHGIGWGNWDYKGGFGIRKDGQATAVLRGLMG